MPENVAKFDAPPEKEWINKFTIFSCHRAFNTGLTPQ